MLACVTRDVVVIGAGPNGLAAAAVLARAGLSVEIHEAAEAIGGGARTEALTLPGFLHDPCAAVHPLAVRSPAFESMPLEAHGLEWVHPELPLAHPQLDGSAAILDRSFDTTANSMGIDSAAYRQLVGPFIGRWSELSRDALAPMTAHRPRHPLLLGKFGMRSILPAALVAKRFHDPATRAMYAGLAAHAITPLSRTFTSGVALMFAIAAHEGGWPFPRGGAQAISDALGSYLREMNVDIVLNHRITSLDELPSARAYVFDLNPEQVARIAGDKLPHTHASKLTSYRRGPAVYKIDYALNGPVPWTNADARRAGTVHLGSSFEEISNALRRVNRGEISNTPFLITSQPTIFDPSRAPEGKHVFWVYAHVPNGYQADMVESIEDQIERFAPGFRSVVLSRSITTPMQIESRNANNVGGDIAGGSFGGLRTVFRPVATRVPYATPNPSIYICSSATPPGPGVHGMCGFHAARTALKRTFRIVMPPE
jgi:phytoene dehydrogenase-like protein